MVWNSRSDLEPEQARARLIFLGDPPTVHLLVGTKRLGRHPCNDIQVLDANVSKEHCIIAQRGDYFVLRDAGSMNGTYLNGALVAGEARLKHLDIVRIGHACARFDELRSLARIEAPMSSSVPSRFGPLESKRHSSSPEGMPRSAGFWAAPASAAESLPRPPRTGGPLHGPQHPEAAPAIGRRHDDDTRRKLQLALRRLSEARDRETASELALDAVLAAAGADRGVTLLRNSAGSFEEHSSRTPEVDKPAVRLVTLGALTHAAERKAVLLTMDAEVGVAVTPAAPTSKRSAIAVPLRHWERVFGIVWVETLSAPTLAAVDLDFLDLVGKQAGLVLAVLGQPPPDAPDGSPGSSTEEA